MKKTLLSLVAVTAIVQAGGNIESMTPLLDVVPEVQGSALDKVSFGGYGKMDYTNYLDKDGKDKLDIYRFILYVGYQFSENIKLVSEIEWEHGGRESTGGYGIVEQAYLDFKMNDALSAKVGHFIVPVGMVNLYHEPTAFTTVSRPETEKYIIPSTWHENGVMLHGKMENISYQAGIIAGLDASDGATSIRGMRQNGQKSKAEDFGFAGRLDYRGNNFYVGASVYSGEAGQGASNVDVTTTISEIHAGINMNGFDLHGLYAMNEIDGNNFDEEGKAQNINTTGAGYYVNASYRMNEWKPFVQYEAYTTDDNKDDITLTTVGLNYIPTEGVVLKGNYVLRDNRGTDDNRVELGIGWSF
ncbi:hypothetical protein MNB_SV-13-2033 [hydrothermal vent metagenome]|uniref:Porin n=1 Tax=hydrothermal vent metagenome TaxID=652676 RepID=A0A1W1BXR4_9ZZZZ